MEHILRIYGRGRWSQGFARFLGDYAGLGGRGLTSAIVSAEVPPYVTR